MFRVTVIVLLLALAGGTAFAQLSVEDIKDEVSRSDTRHFAGYRRAVNNRDFFANIHDTWFRHAAYKEMKGARDTYVAIRTEISHAIAEGEAGKATKRIADLTAAGTTLDEKVEAYLQSSSSGVLKIQIGLGVAAFVIVGVFAFVFRRLRRR